MVHICTVCKKPVYSDTNRKRLYHGDVKVFGSCNYIRTRQRAKELASSYQAKAKRDARRRKEAREKGYDDPELYGDDSWMQG